MALHSALLVQRKSSESLEVLAGEVGFHDAASFSRHLLRVFGYRPSFIRECLGWAWLLNEWIVRRQPQWRIRDPVLH
jgi:hypothetical protein